MKKGEVALRLKVTEILSLELERIDILRKINTFPCPSKPEQKEELGKLMQRNLEIMTQLGYEEEVAHGKMLTKEEEVIRGLK